MSKLAAFFILLTMASIAFGTLLNYTFNSATESPASETAVPSVLGISLIEPSNVTTGVTSEIAGNESEFYLHIWANESLGLKNATLMTNNNGTFIEEATIELNDTDSEVWANHTIRLNSTPGKTINWMWIVNDIDGNFTIIPFENSGSLLTTDGTNPIIAYGSYNTTIAGQKVLFRAYAKAGLPEYNITNWSFRTNSTGNWITYQNITENNSIWLEVETNLANQPGYYIWYEWNITDSMDHSYSTGFVPILILPSPSNLGPTYRDIFENYYAYLNGWDMYGSNPDTLLAIVNDTQYPLKDTLSQHGWNSSHIMVDNTGELTNLQNFITTSGMDENSTLFVFFASHGNIDIFINWHHYGELQSILESGPQKRNVIFILACYSGSAIDTTLNNTKNNILTSTNKSSLSNILPWTDALRNSLFGKPIVDINGDGLITDEEVYNSTYSLNYYSHPIFSPNTGSYIPLTIFDSLNPTISVISANTSLYGRPVMYTSVISDDVLIDSYMWSTNSSGNITNSSWIVWTDNPVTLNGTTNDTVGAINSVTLYVKDVFNKTSYRTAYILSTADYLLTPVSSHVNSTIIGKPTLFNMEWTAGSSISGYIFSFDNCTGSFANETWTELTGITNSTNNTKTINTTSGCTIRWRVHTNDTSGHWNSSMIMSFTAVTTDGATCSLASQCVGGYCVHSYCRSLPTHAGDGYCDIGELSSPDCISSSPSTSTTSPSGSIGSSVPTIKEETNLSWVLNSSTVKEIGITTNDTGSVELNISWVEIPVSIMPAGKVYASMEVKSANSSLINKAYIDFSVNKTWLNTNRIDKTDIVLYRWTDRWEELPTGIKNENGDSILYTAETSGFSFFVIGVRGADMSTILDIENPIVYIIPRVLIISVVITIIVFGAIVKHSFRSLRKKLSR